MKSRSQNECISASQGSKHEINHLRFGAKFLWSDLGKREAHLKACRTSWLVGRPNILFRSLGIKSESSHPKFHLDVKRI